MEEQQQQTQWSDLPNNVVLEVMKRLPLRDALRCASVQRSFKEALPTVLASLESLEPAGNVTAQACIWVGSSPHLPKLSVIRVNGAATATGLAFLASSDLGQQRLGQLRVLSIDTCKQLQPESLHAALRHCSNLESLTLINCPRLQDSACVLISTCCPKLRKLVLQDLYNLYDDGVAHLARELPYLEELHLDGAVHLSSKALEFIGSHARALRRLSVAKCTKMKDQGLESLAAGCPRLSYLNLFQCYRVTSVRCLRVCPLVELDMSGCTKISDEDLQALLAGGAGQTMLSLTLDGCLDLSGSTMAVIGTTCPKLQVLRCSRWQDLQDPHLEAFAEACRTLRSLSLVWCTRITDAGLRRVLQANPGLETLDLEGCYNLTDATLEHLRVYTPGLTSLNIRLCHGLTADAITRAVAGTEVMSLHVSGVLTEQATTQLVLQVRALRPKARLYY